MRPRLKLNKKRILKVLSCFSGRKVLIVGDLMLDHFVWGAVSRISPEAPVPVVEITRESMYLGGAGNVANNIRALGGVPIVVGVIGDDPAGQIIREQLQLLQITDGIVVDKGRTSTVKMRIIAHNQQVCRADREDRAPISQRAQDELARRIAAALPGVEAMIISDYAKGVISGQLLGRIMPLARKHGIWICIDPKPKNFPYYRRASLITPNQAEAEFVSGVKIEDFDTLVEAARRIMKRTACQHLVITRGEQGMALFEGDGSVIEIPALAREVFDVTGAGDTVISALTLAVASGATVLDAAHIANVAAGIVVGKLGTATVTVDELRDQISRYR